MKNKKFIDIVETMLIENHRQLNEDIASLDAMGYSKVNLKETKVNLKETKIDLKEIKTTRVVLDSDMKRKIGVSEDYINMFG